MEKFLVTWHGHWGHDSMPDMEQYVMLGMDKTSTGKSAGYAWGLKNSVSAQELANFIESHLRFFAGSIFKFEFHNSNLIIKTVAPGAWIGRSGRWVKGMTTCLRGQYARVKIVPIPTIMGDSSWPFTFRYAVGWEQVFWDKVSHAVVGHERVISKSNDHNYLGDKWGLDIPEQYFERLKKLKAGLEASARAKQERDYEAGERIEEEYKSFAYFSSTSVALQISRDREYLLWVTNMARKLFEILGKKNGIYTDHIYLGGSCERDSEKDRQMLEKIKNGLNENDYEIVGVENHPGQYKIVPRGLVKAKS